MNHFLQWLHMGGYSLYVWPAYGLACLFFIGIALSIRLQTRRTQKWLAQWYERWGS